MRVREEDVLGLAIACALVLMLKSCETHAAPPPDPGQPIYQNAIPGLPVAPGVRVGGSWHEKAWPKPPIRTLAQQKLQHQADLDRIDVENRATTLRRGLAAITTGGLLFICALVAHLASKASTVPFLHNLLEGGMYGGASLLLFGLGLWALIEFYFIAVLLIAVSGLGAFGWLAYRLKHKGI